MTVFAPPALPTVPASDRVVGYDASGLTVAAVPFTVWGNGDNLAVFLNAGDPDIATDWQTLTTGWTFSSASGLQFPTPITDGRITFDSPVTGRLIIEGHREPQRTSNTVEGQDTARTRNTDTNTIVATLQEHARRLDRALSLTPGATFSEGEWDAKGKRVTNAADGIDDQDLVTVRQFREGGAGITDIVNDGVGAQWVKPVTGLTAHVRTARQGSYITAEERTDDILISVDPSLIDTVAAYAQEAKDARDAILAADFAGFLLGGKHGYAYDFVNNTSRGIGGSGPWNGDAWDGPITFSRNDVGWNWDVNGFAIQYAVNAPIIARRPSDAAVQGLWIGTQIQPLIYYSNNFADPGWLKTHGLVMTPAAGAITDPAGGSNAWIVADNDATDSGLGFSLLSRSILNAVSTNTGFLFATWFHEKGSDRANFKHTINPTLPTLVTNGLYALDSGTPLNAINCDVGIEPFPGAWYKCTLTGYTASAPGPNMSYVLFPAISDPVDTTDLYMWGALVYNQMRDPGYRAPDEFPRKPAVTVGQWTTLSGNATIGLWTSNVITDTSPNAGWTLSNVTATVVAGGGVGGIDAYDITDTSAVAIGFAQRNETGLGVNDRIWIAFFADTAASGCSDVIGVQTSFSGGTTIEAQFEFNIRSQTAKVNANPSPGAADCDILPVDATHVACIMWFTNNGTASNTTYHLGIYPDYAGATGVKKARICAIGAKVNASALWTKPAIVPLDSDHVEVATATTAFTRLTGTLFMDWGTLQKFEPGATVELRSLNDGTNANAFRMYIQAQNDGTFDFVGRLTATGSPDMELRATNVELNPGRWWLRWGPDGQSIGKDEEVLDSDATLGPRPLGIDRDDIGQTAGLDKQPDAALKHAVYIAEVLTETDLGSRGILNVAGNPVSRFTEADFDRVSERVVDATIRLKARTRSNLQNYTAMLSYILVWAQSFGRSSLTGGPPYTTPTWLADKPWRKQARMYGGSVRGSVNTGTVFSPITDMDGAFAGAAADQFNIACATMDAGNSVLNQAELELGYANLQDNFSNYVGEASVVAMAHEFARRDLARKGLVEDLSRLLMLLNTCSATDSTINAIGNPAGDNWLRFKDSLDKTIARAIALGYPLSQQKVMACSVDHGESSYSLFFTKNQCLDGGTSDSTPGYRAVFDNITSMAQTATGQTTDVYKVISLPSQHWTKPNLAPTEAFVQMVAERSDCGIACVSAIAQSGSEPDSDKPLSGGEHPASRLGYRTIALHKARHLDTVIALGQNDFPPEPYELWQLGRFLLLSVMAMDYPLQHKRTYGYYNPALVDILQHGYQIELGAQEFGIRAATCLAQDGLVLFELASVPDGLVDLVFAGSKGSQGRGELFDSGGETFGEWAADFLFYDDAVRDITEMEDGIPDSRRMCRPFRMTAKAWEG